MHIPTMLKLSAPDWSPRHTVRGLACIALCLLLAACGFRMKGVSPLPFTTLYTNIAENSEFGAGLRRAVVASSPATRFVDEPADAQARLTQLVNRQSLRELSIDAEGQVEEYELNLEFVFQLTDDKGHLVLPPTTLRSIRELPYDPNVVQAKEGEIAMVFKEMRQSLIDQIVRRLSAPEVTEAFEQAATLPANEGEAEAGPVPAESIVPVPDLDSPSSLSAPQIDPNAALY